MPYPFYTGPMVTNLVRDAPKMPVVAELPAPQRHYLAAVRHSPPDGTRGRRGGLLLVAARARR